MKINWMWIANFVLVVMCFSSAAQSRCYEQNYPTECITSNGCPGTIDCVGGRPTKCIKSGECCTPGSVTSCAPTEGACGQHTCAANGKSFGACTQILCGVCTPGDKRACDYKGSQGTSHCAFGVQACNSYGSGFGDCTDPTYQCGTWSSIDFKECAFTGMAKHAGVLADIPSGDNKQAYVLNHKATVFGIPMNAKAYSSDVLGNSWGTFAVQNTSCFVYNISYLKTCYWPFGGSILYMNQSTGKTFREGTGFPCLGACYSVNERKVFSNEPNWGDEPFNSNIIGGTRLCETIIGKTFEW